MSEVGDRIIRNFAFLRRVAKTSSRERRWQMVENATRDELLAIVEICSNILSSDFVLTARQKRRLKPYVDFMRKLAKTKSETSARQLFHQQQEGGAAVLPSLLLPVLIEAARSLLSSNE